MRKIAVALCFIFAVCTLLASWDVAAKEEECLSREEAQGRWPSAALLATRHITEIGVVGGLGMGFVVEDGSLIVDPDMSGPAAAAGLKRNDRVVAIGGREITTFHNDREIVQALRGAPGTSLELTVERFVRLERLLFSIVVVRAAMQSVDFHYCWGPNKKFM